MTYYLISENYKTNQANGHRLHRSHIALVCQQKDHKLNPIKNLRCVAYSKYNTIFLNSQVPKASAIRCKRYAGAHIYKFILSKS